MSKVTYEVDFWKTDMHGIEVGLKQKEENMAKSRQFSRDLDLYAEVKKEDEKIGYVGYRTNSWKDKDLSQRRLIIKYFTENISWKGTMEMLVGRSLVNSIIMEEPAPVFIINLPRHDFLLDLRRIRPKSLNAGVNYGLELIDEDKLYIIQFDDKRMTAGDDFSIKDGFGKKIGTIDSKIFNVGGKVEIKIQKEALELDGLESSVILFVSFLKFREDVEKLIKTQIEAFKKRKLGALDKYELQVLMNPRRPVM